MRRRLVAALAAGSTVLSGCGFTGLYSADLPGGADLGNHPYNVTIEFKDVLDLVPQSAVKVNDVAVGKVDSITLGTDKKEWVAKVTVSVNGSVRLPANARASVQQTSLLGEKYVSLSQPTGQPSATPLKNGSHIDISRTNSAVEAEQVLGALSLLLNEGGLRQIRSIAIELNKAFNGKARQAAIRDLIGQLTTFTGTLDRQKNDITTAIVNVNTLAATLNKQKATIVGALETFPAALQVLNQQRTKLVTLLTSLSHLGSVANRVINATQTNLVSSLKAMAPVLRSLTAVGNPLIGALRIAGTFPFPLGITRQFVKGDYANLAAVLNLNITDQLCGFAGLCASGSSTEALAKGTGVLNTLSQKIGISLPLPGGSKSPVLPLKRTSNSAGATPLPSMLIGAGR